MRKVYKNEYLTFNNFILQNKRVLDLACHGGESTKIITQCNPAHVYGVDIRPNKIKEAIETVNADNVEFVIGDITDPAVILPLVQNSNVITFLGGLYHLFDHFRFFSYILQPHVEHVLIETLFGPETKNPNMYWGFEETDNDLHGWLSNCSMIPHGTPNLAWIIKSANIFGFDCDWVKSYVGGPDVFSKEDFLKIKEYDYNSVAGPNWPSYQAFCQYENVPKFVLDEIQAMLLNSEDINKRMVLRLYNTKLIQSTPVDLDDIFIWENIPF